MLEISGSTYEHFVASGMAWKGLRLENLRGHTLIGSASMSASIGFFAPIEVSIRPRHLRPRSRCGVWREAHGQFF
jgi:hypothetical protein